MSNILYPYDPTGSAITNRVVTSIDLPRVRNRAFAPDGAPFYKDSVVIKVKATGVELPKKSYEILRLNVAATAATDKPVASIINITDENFYGEIEATVQVVGGPNINNAAAIQKMLDILASDGRTVKFSELIDVPVTMPPSYHLTYVGDLYGAESLVAALDRITAISSQGTEVTLELLNDRYDRIFDIINSLSETGGAAGLDIELLKQQVADNLIRTSNLIRQLTTTVTNHRSDSETSLEALNVRLVDHSSQLQLLVLEDTSIRDSIQAHKDAYEAYKVQMTQVTDEIDQRIDVHLNDYAQHLANYSDLSLIHI